MSSVPAPSPDKPVAVPLLSALIVVLLPVCAGLFYVGQQHEQSRSDLVNAREAAVRAARQAIINLDSISATTVDGDVARVIAGATGQYKDLFTRSVADLKGIVVQRKSESGATIRSAGVVRADTDTATVLVAVDRTLKDNTTTEAVVQPGRWRLELEKHNGRWLVARLDPVA